MAPRKQKPRWQSAIVPQQLSLSTGTRKSSRIASKYLTAIATPSTSLTVPPPPSRGKRIRQHDPLDDLAENSRPAKRRQISLPSKLTQENLQKFTEEMCSKSDVTPTPSIKRTSSQRSMSDVTHDTVPSQRSSSTLAHYRHRDLASAMVYVQNRPPPEPIRTNIDTIIRAPVSTRRKEELVVISENLCDMFAEVLAAAAGEDDCIEPLHTALSSMDRAKCFLFPRKADWRQCLKPRVRRSPFSFQGFMGNVLHNTAVDNSTVHSPKRQVAAGGPSYISPTTSRTKTSNNLDRRNSMDSDMEAMPPPPPPPDSDKDSPSIKTPRPDIITGLRIATVTKALASHGLNNTEANFLLKGLQEATNCRAPDLPPEPILCSEPTQRALSTRFPFLIVEGKSHATGKSVYEAQNQAAVSGACALKILHDLAELDAKARGVAPDPGTATPVVFSICTQGPHHELWGHYTTMEDDIRRFNMSILKTCHGSLLDGVLDFLVAVDNILCWGGGAFLDGIAEQLGNVAKSAWSAGKQGERGP